MAYTGVIEAADPMNDNGIERGGISHMKIEELNQEQIEKARSLATDEERLAYLKECRVELDDDMLSEVSGGFDHIHLPDCAHEWKKPEKEEVDRFLVGLMT